MTKYGNRPTVQNGYLFDSQAESRRYFDLLILERTGEIAALEVHPSYELQPAFKDKRGRKHRAIRYEGDFSYQEGGKLVVEDIKGVRTPAFILKEKLFLYKYPDIDLRVIAV
jgi:hypothetical protein